MGRGDPGLLHAVDACDYMVIGERGATEGTVAVRRRTGGDQGSSALDAFVQAAQQEIATKGRP